MARVNVGPAQLDLVGLTAGRDAQLALTVQDQYGDPLTPTSAVMHVVEFPNAVTVTDVMATITTGTLTLDLAPVVALDSGMYVYELEVDGASWLKGSCPVASYTDGHGSTSSRISGSITVANGTGTATLTVQPSQQMVAYTPITLTDAATITLNASLGHTYKVTLGGNRTLAITNPTNGQVIELIVIQDGTGSRTLTLPAEVNYSTDAPSSLYTLSTTAGARDRLVFTYYAPDDQWDFVSFMRGF